MNLTFKREPGRKWDSNVKFAPLELHWRTLKNQDFHDHRMLAVTDVGISVL
jgi:hypothetical protein